MMCRLTRLARLFVVAAATAVLASCYLPVRFDSEVVLQPNGIYSAIFDGYLVDTRLYNSLHKGHMNSDEEQKQVDLILTDLKRSPDVTVAKYMRNAVFHVTWKHKGDIIREKMYTFIRRNQAFFTFMYEKDRGRIVITGKQLSNRAVDDLDKMGLGAVEGQLRIKAAAHVSKNNAQRVVKWRRGGYIYIWNIKSYRDPAPRLIMPIR